jgi:5-methylcytosine-specific restriction enzyme B
METDKHMSLSDDVRNYCNKMYVDPARKSGEKTITIRSGDIHNALNYRNRYPLVCSALGSNIFEDTSKVRRLSIEGPLNGSSTEFTFEIL